MSSTAPDNFQRALHEIGSLFEALATKIEHTIEAFSGDDNAPVDLAALHRAKESAQRGASLTRNATNSEVRRAFDRA